MSYRMLPRAGALMVLGVTACARMARMESPYLDHVQAPAPVARAIDQSMRGFAAEGFTGTVLVAEGSRVLLYQGYGQANRARELPNNAETRYPLGAVENLFTAAALMRLEADGRLSTRDPVNRYVAAPSDERIDELLSRIREVPTVAYSGGMVRPVGDPGEPLAERFTTPGESYATLRQVIEQASGESYEAYVEEHLLRPYGLTRTFWERGTSGDSLVARGYKEPLGETVLAHGMVAPLADLYRWQVALRDNQIMSPEAKQRMFAPAPNGYGYGLVISSTPGGAKVVEHAGDQAGFQTWFAWFPERQILILLAVNNDGGWRRLVADRLTELMVDSVGRAAAVVTQ
jgi:CubicO group peptidase (beta-lactamase class C family)